MNNLSLEKLDSYLNQLFNVSAYEDYGPNGLQVQGTEIIKSVGFSVSATKESIQLAVHHKVNALIVHHGLFWKFHGPRPIVGTHKERIAPLIKNDINLFGLHLPLDGHMELGNARGLADSISLTNLKPFGLYKGMPTGVYGEISKVCPNQLKSTLMQLTNHPVFHASAEREKIKTIGIITGGANSGWKEAYELGLDAYITGEMSEHDWHDAIESNIHMYACGHHASERFGVLSLKKQMEKDFSDTPLRTYFFDSKNPV